MYGEGSNIKPEKAETCAPVAEDNEDFEKYENGKVTTINMSASDYAGIDTRWYQDIGDCRSTVSKNDAEEITIVKSLIYYNSDTEDGTEPIDLGSKVWLTGNGGRVSVKFTCKFASTFTAKSDEIAIEAGKAVEGKLEASGSWADSLTLQYTDSTYTTAVSNGAASVLGSDLYAKISWDVSSSLSANLHYYVNSCEVRQLTVDSGDPEKWSYESGNGNIKIFDKGLCAAGVVNTAMASGNTVHGKGDWKFNFRSFSFNSGGNDRQQLECEVKFCINKDYENSKGVTVTNECTGVKDTYDTNQAAEKFCTDGASDNFKWGKVTLA